MDPLNHPNDRVQDPVQELVPAPAPEEASSAQAVPEPEPVERVLVLGLGASGLAMARWCGRAGSLLRVWDSRDAPPQLDTLLAEWPQAERLSANDLPVSALEGVSLVLKSPGLAPYDERITPLLQEARLRGIPVSGELDLFAKALAQLQQERGYAPKLIAITGTNGKTTTTAMTTLLVQRTGQRVVMAGNVGPTMLDTLSEVLVAEDQAIVKAQAEAAAKAKAEAQEAAVAAQALAAAAAADATQAAEAAVATQAAQAADVALAEKAEVDVPVDTAVAAVTEEALASSIEDQDPDLEDLDDEPVAPAAPPDEEAALDLASLLPPSPPEPIFPCAHTLPQVWVLELSSFQLEGGGTGVQGFEPHAATVLNISQDHLDWHGSMPAYVAAKQRVFGSKSVMVLNADDAAVAAMLPPPPVAVKGGKFKAGPRAPRVAPRPVQWFGGSAPQHPGDFGIVVEGGMAWLARALPLEEGYKPKAGEEIEIHLQRLMPVDALRVRGRHNATNAQAALALATAVGCPLAPMLHGLREYAGEPHRVQWVLTVDGVQAFDDSKGTNVGATVAALNGLGADQEPAKLLVILGGQGKGQDFAPLLEPLRRHARAVATLGADAAAIESALSAAGGLGLPLQRHAGLHQAVAWCFEQAQSGDAVLLSPACASLDMFRNYEHRAQVFVQAVKGVAAERGLVA
jgi:UDP-N-acetylmuramoylalanine--D-glutamate ligase